MKADFSAAIRGRNVTFAGQVDANEGPPSMTYVFRKGSPTIFSIEQIFNRLYSHFQQAGGTLRRVELPFISTGIIPVLRNIWFMARQPKSRLLHITGDVHYAALLLPFHKTIVTVHDCVVMQRGVGLKRLVLWTLWFGLPLRLASAITVISEQTKNELLRTVAIPESKIAVIPNFVDPAFSFSERPIAGLPRILHVGTTPNKNLPRVVAALRGIRCVLVIVGELSDSTLKAIQDSDIHHENFVGLEHASLLRLYRDADIISFPSTYEGFGMPILEGQATGRPVLTSDLEPMRSVAGPGGALLIDPHSIDAIRGGFVALLTDGDLRSRLTAAGRENCKRYTLEAVAERYAALYRTIAAT